VKVAEKILQDLLAGNQRFLQGSAKGKVWQARNRNAGQSPKAIVLGCADSRVPIETIFDQGPGDLFVIRVAGNIAAPSQIGSIEFAVENFSVPLVIILGHTHCGAIEATMTTLETNSSVESDNLKSIIDYIAPAIAELCSTKTPQDQRTFQCLLANIRGSANKLQQDSTILANLIASGQLAVVSAYYDIDLGTVNIID